MIVQPIMLHDAAEPLQQAEVVALDLVRAFRLTLSLFQLESYVRPRGRRAVVDCGKSRTDLCSHMPDRYFKLSVDLFMGQNNGTANNTVSLAY